MRIALSVIAILATVFCLHADPAWKSPVKLDVFRSAKPPFSFTYGGKNSVDFLSTWTRTEHITSNGGRHTAWFTFTDPTTGLELTAEARTYDHYPALYWALTFTNKGTKDTPLLENVKSVDWPGLLPGPGHDTILHGGKGGGGGQDDYEPIERAINGGDGLRSELGSKYQLPFFELQSGDNGLVGAMGWWGRWNFSFLPDKDDKTIGVSGGMPDIHLLLHPGESIRMPSVLLMPTKGDWLDADNLWRHLAIDYLSPLDPKGKRIDVPLAIGGWGEEPIDKKLALIHAIHAAKIPMEVYWVDAGWYGDPTKFWITNIGDWKPAAKDYPNGIRPLGDELHKLDYKFLLWMCAGEAAPTSQIAKDHPDWWIAQGKDVLRAKFENPAVAKGITDTVIATMKDAGADWFRQDGASPAAGPGEPPDRAGFDEIQYVNNYLKFWDDLRTAIPGMQIDNCYGGGDRLDLETIQRSVSLWRSDSMAGPYDISMEACQAQGMIQWVPMSGGVYPISGAKGGSPQQLYEARSTYCAGWDFGITKVEDWMRAQALEYKEVQPYFYGDFYQLLHYTPSLDAWSAWQLYRPDLKSGVVILLRRQQSPLTTIQVQLRHIDPAATYEVEVRHGIDHATSQKMTGAELLKLNVPIPDQPGSALVFYRKN